MYAIHILQRPDRAPRSAAGDAGASRTPQRSPEAIHPTSQPAMAASGLCASNVVLDAWLNLRYFRQAADEGLVPAHGAPATAASNHRATGETAAGHANRPRHRAETNH